MDGYGHRGGLVSTAYHCDRDGCDSWQRVGGIEPFLTVNHAAETIGHFCCLDCLTIWAAAHSEPTEIMQT
jgi:hypothetical protein